ncbi:uncharacterized protein EAF01_004126 [Botrytis porri]|uniref:uncharacterized protein n=1 Tax=Botrytis porri TaxID=87229 RepID=UPI0018FF79DA|nr:uncharacterized protein EAF01_004126 [Botrytis porri]KAF7908371.1 hypothetical protein EAF01_004126 [Botrytis porri]
MSGILSKRQLARNEQALQELVKLPGNNVCADCQARNPGWASWSLGIFLCMRCAALHRKLGTHITKVKSLSMDSWSKDQVDHMKKTGNVASNRIYNPKNTRPPIPIDADEADSAMERFIRQKYANGPPAQRRNNTGSSSSDDHPPPLPPKNGTKFGFRSASSIFPLSSKAKKDNADAQAEFDDYSQAPSPPRKNKHSRIFGTSLDATDDLESKLVKLRDMGFRDEKRNTAVLKGLGGNLEKAIETLVRLGEGGSSARTASSINSSGPRTPASPPGLSFERPRATSPSISSASNNPFDRLDNPVFLQTQSTQSTGSMAHGQNQIMEGNPYQNIASTNPFGLMPSQSQLNLSQAFQNMSVSSSQPLFPHHTGGLPGSQPPPVQQLYQQSMTPPVPSLPQHHYAPVTYENPGQQPQSQQMDRNNLNTNPFMQQASPQPVVNTNLQSNPYMQQSVMKQPLFASPVTQTPQQQYPSGSYNMGMQNPPQQMNPFFNQASQQQQQQAQQQQAQQQQQQRSQLQYGYQQQQQPQSQYQQPQVQPQQAQYDQYRQQTYPMMPQQTGRLVDKRSILDLYNYPQLAPTQIQQQQQPEPMQHQAPQVVEMPQPNGQMPGGSNNPFMSNVAAAPTSANGSGRQISRESMMIDAGSWQNGRHSPDAWGQISGRR